MTFTCCRHREGRPQYKLRMAREPTGGALDDRRLCSQLWACHCRPGAGLCGAKDHSNAGCVSSPNRVTSVSKVVGQADTCLCSNSVNTAPCQSCRTPLNACCKRLELCVMKSAGGAQVCLGHLLWCCKSMPDAGHMNDSPQCCKGAGPDG